MQLVAIMYASSKCARGMMHCSSAIEMGLARKMHTPKNYTTEAEMTIYPIGCTTVCTRTRGSLPADWGSALHSYIG